MMHEIYCPTCKVKTLFLIDYDDMYFCVECKNRFLAMDNREPVYLKQDEADGSK